MRRKTSSMYSIISERFGARMKDQSSTWDLPKVEIWQMEENRRNRWNQGKQEKRMKLGWVLVKRLRLLRLWSIAQIEENRPLGLRDHSTTRLERVRYLVLIQRWWNSFGFVWLGPIDPSSLTMSLTNLQVKIQMFDWGQILGCRFKELLGNFEVAV